MKRTIIIFVAALLPVISVASDKTEEPIQQKSKKVLIIYEDTRFKKDLINEIGSLLKKDSVEVTQIEYEKGNLDKINPADYDAVFITNSGVNSKVRPWAVSWITKNEKSVENVLVHTTQTKSWDPKISVNAVTSASALPEAKKLAKEYTAKIKDFFVAKAPFLEEKIDQ